MFAMSTDANVSAAFSDVTVMNCETGIRILASNGLDPNGIGPERS